MNASDHGARIDRVHASINAGRGAEARVELLALLADFPSDDGILNALGSVELAAGSVDQAVAYFNLALAANPQRPDTLCNLGAAALMRGEPALAESYFRDSLSMAPDLPQAGFELARLLAARGQRAEAHEVLWRCGSALVASGGTLAATALFAEVLRIAPTDQRAQGLLGALYLDLDRLDAAERCYAQLLDLAPNDAAACHGLGMVATRAGRHTEALRWLRRAVAAQAVFPHAHNSLANVYARGGQTRLALKHYRLAVAQDPHYTDAWINFADEWLALGQRAAAAAACERCLAIDPEHALAHFRRAQLRLAAGDWRDGWIDHEWRVAALGGRDYLPDPRDVQRILPRPSQWAQQDLRGKHLLLLPEQGLGDELFCLRFVPALRAAGVRISHLASRKLLPLLLPGSFDALLSDAMALPDTDYTLAVGELPLVAIAQGLAAVVEPLAISPPTMAGALDARLAAAGPAPYLGVTWRAGLAHDGVRRKVIALQDLGPALRAWPGTLVALQRDAAVEECALLAALSRRPVLDFCAEADDLSAVASLLELLDEYVAVSNTNVHLRASRGHRARVLVGVPGEWRWGVEEQSSLWFPNTRLYRQQADGRGWKPALARLRADLQAWAASTSTSA